MFERYTEKARRVVFFARYESSQFGSPYIETEHLLLGLLRENKVIAAKLLKSPAAIEVIRKKVESATPRRIPTATSVDLPLSNESKRVLIYAAEEAELLSHEHIGTEHLLLGLLREGGGIAAHLLNEEGVTLEQARKEIATWPVEPATLRGAVANLRDRRPQVEVHGKKFDLQAVGSQADRLRRFAWIRREWKPMDVVVDNQEGGISFEVSVADGQRYQLQPGGWTKEPCAICGWELRTEGGPERTEGFTNGRRWLCRECYRRFVARKDGGPSSWEST